MQRAISMQRAIPKPSCYQPLVPNTSVAITIVPPFTTTESDGNVVSCASSTSFNYAVNTNAECAGATAVVSTVASIASAYSLSTASAASASSASAASASSAAAASASWAAAAVTPSASCWIIEDDGWGALAFKVYSISGWAGDDGSSLAKQESGCGIFSGSEWHTDGESEFDGQQRATQYAYFGLSFVKSGCVERVIHSPGSPSPGTGPGQVQCEYLPSDTDAAVEDTAVVKATNTSSSGDQGAAVQRIASAQLAAVQAVVKGSSANGTTHTTDSAGTQAARPDPSLMASASALLPHLMSEAPRPTGS